jgi:RNA polymerase sigma-70 factor (ECF subfamily)
MVYGHALRMLHDPALAEDAAQDTFITAYRQLHQLRDPRAFPGWLRAITRSQCTRLLRREHPEHAASQLAYDLELLPEPNTLEQLIEAHEHSRTVSYAIQRLPESQRDITERFYLQEQSQQEIAAELALPLTTVKKRLQYAREHLRRFFIEFSTEFNAVTDELVGAVGEAVGATPPEKPELARVPVPVYAKRRPPHE